MGCVLTLLLRGRGQRRQPRWDSQQMEANGFRRRLNVTCAWGNSNAIAIALHTHTYMHVRLAGILSTSKIDYMPISTSSTYVCAQNSIRTENWKRDCGWRFRMTTDLDLKLSFDSVDLEQALLGRDGVLRTVRRRVRSWRGVVCLWTTGHVSQSFWQWASSFTYNRPNSPSSTQFVSMYSLLVQRNETHLLEVGTNRFAHWTLDRLLLWVTRTRPVKNWRNKSKELVFHP